MELLIELILELFGGAATEAAESDRIPRGVRAGIYILIALPALALMIWCAVLCFQRSSFLLCFVVSALTAVVIGAVIRKLIRLLR